jgi:hypothetical protein
MMNLKKNENKTILVKCVYLIHKVTKSISFNIIQKSQE